MTTHPERSELSEPQRTIAIICVLAAMALAVLDAAMINVALPSVAQSMHVTPAMSVRIVTAYQVALVMALLPCAALGERLGYRRIFTAGIALFIVASVCCATSPTLSWLVAARCAQGLGAAAIMALGVALLRFVVSDRQLGSAIGWNALTVALCAAAGPTIGAIILSGTSWHWLFALNLPIGGMALLAARALPVVPGTAQRIDVTSIALNGATFAALVVGAELLPTSPLLAGVLFIVAATAMIVLVRRELPKPDLLIPLDLLQDKAFRTAVLASVCCFAGQSAGLVALPFYLQHELGQTPMTTGLYMTPWPLAVAIAAPVTSRLANNISATWLCVSGGTCLAIGLATAAILPLHGDPRPLAAIMLLCGLGFGLFQVPNNRAMFLAAPRERSAAAGGMQGTARLTGQTAGAVIMTLLLTLTPMDMAPCFGLAIGAMLALAAGIISLHRAIPAIASSSLHFSDHNDEGAFQCLD